MAKQKIPKNIKKFQNIMTMIATRILKKNIYIYTYVVIPYCCMLKGTISFLSLCKDVLALKCPSLLTGFTCFQDSRQSSMFYIM